MGKTHQEAFLRENNLILAFGFSHARRPTLRDDRADITYVQASKVVTEPGSENHTFQDSSNEALSHQFGIGYCYATEPDVDECFAIGACIRNEIQKIFRCRPVEFWIVQEPANGMRIRFS